MRDITHQQTLLEAENKTVEELRVDIAAKQQTLADTRQALVSTTQELKTTVDNIGQLTKENIDLQKGIQVKRQELMFFEKQKLEAQREAQVQNVKVQKLRQKLDALNIRDKQLFADVQHLEGKLTQKKNEIDRSQKSVTAITDKIRIARENESNRQRAVETTTADVSSIDQRIAQNAEQIAQTERAFQEASRALRQSNESSVAHQEQRRAHYQRLEKLEETITKLKEHHCELQQKYEEKSAALAQQELQRRERIKAGNTAKTVLTEQTKRRN